MAATCTRAVPASTTRAEPSAVSVRTVRPRASTPSATPLSIWPEPFSRIRRSLKMRPFESAASDRRPPESKSSDEPAARVSTVVPSNNVALPATVASSTRKLPLAATVPMAGVAAKAKFTFEAQIKFAAQARATTDCTVSSFSSLSFTVSPLCLVAAGAEFSLLLMQARRSLNSYPRVIPTLGRKRAEQQKYPRGYAQAGKRIVHEGMQEHCKNPNSPYRPQCRAHGPDCD